MCGVVNLGFDLVFVLLFDLYCFVGVFVTFAVFIDCYLWCLCFACLLLLLINSGCLSLFAVDCVIVLLSTFIFVVLKLYCAMYGQLILVYCLGIFVTVY